MLRPSPNHGTLWLPNDDDDNDDDEADSWAPVIECMACHIWANTGVVSESCTSLG